MWDMRRASERDFDLMHHVYIMHYLYVYVLLACTL